MQVRFQICCYLWGTEGARGRESYSPSDIINKYIYDAFLMIDLSILFLLYFIYFELIRDSQRTKAVILQFCKTVRQDNISKRVAFEREPLTLSRDNEDQSKYYLSHPKPYVLDMKWEDQDINAAEY